MKNAVATDELAQPETNRLTGEPTDDRLVLLVDDTVDNLVLFSIVLQQKGYRVVTASNGEEAIKAALLAHPDVILMDIGMPKLDGLGAARKIKEYESLNDTPIIAITAFSTDGFRRAAYDAEFAGYMTKPLDFERLDELIRGVLREHNTTSLVEERKAG